MFVNHSSSASYRTKEKKLFFSDGNLNEKGIFNIQKGKRNLEN